MNAATPTISTDVAAASRVVDAPADVVELARTAARQDAGAPGLVGSFVDAVSEDAVALTLRFATTEVAYTGWTWCVTVALVDPTQPTISEVVLLPGPDSLLPPPWLPWNERIRPGDLGPGDLLLAPAEDDPRLVPAYVESDDPAVEDVAHELGIGRVRVMSRAGRTDTAERWHDSAFGPTADMAKQAPLHCVMCAFFLPLAGSLGARFGACGNEMSPADGRIVDLGYGCGAHSENVIEPVPTGFRPSHIDDSVLDVHPRTTAGGGFADGAAAFLGEDDSELEVAPTRDGAEAHEVSAAPEVSAVDEVPVAEVVAAPGETGSGAGDLAQQADDVAIVDVAIVDVVAVDVPVVEIPVEDVPGDELPADEARNAGDSDDETRSDGAPMDEAPAAEAPAPTAVEEVGVEAAAVADEAPVDPTTLDRSALDRSAVDGTGDLEPDGQSTPDDADV